MNPAPRLAAAIAIVLLDGIVFFVPFSALFLAYIIIFNPPWFRTFLERLNHS